MVLCGLVVGALKELINTRFAEMGVAFQHCNFFFSIFQKTSFEKNFEKKIFHLFYSNFFSIILEKEVNIFFFQFFFPKCFFKN